MMKVRRVEDDSLILDKTHHAKRFMQRLRGLLGRKSLLFGEGVLFEPGGSIHTLGMRFSIDVLFLDHAGMILNKHLDVAPNRLCFAPADTRYVLEMPCKTILLHELNIGQQLRWYYDVKH